MAESNERIVQLARMTAGAWLDYCKEDGVTGPAYDGLMASCRQLCLACGVDPDAEEQSTE